MQKTIAMDKYKEKYGLIKDNDGPLKEYNAERQQRRSYVMANTTEIINNDNDWQQLLPEKTKAF